ncbi:MAG: lycopene cyclase domain-containing protein [Actinomycetota bacterium]|jgi:lycopene cyclase domain-containing protein|nr:lycopene cyclase domain-containing protein [Actinomycetota bacterium]
MAQELSYLGIALPPVLLAGLIALLFRKRLNLRALGWATALVLLMTLVFDNLIILAGIVGYDETLISGIRLGIAPIEDFSYTLVGLVLIPLTWELLGKKK